MPRLLFSALLALLTLPLAAQLPDSPEPPTLAPHPSTTRYYIAGQANIIFQAHAPFHSPYAGHQQPSFGRGEYKTSLLGTLYLGATNSSAPPATRPNSIVNFESAGGRGISEALGLAGFTNLDVVRNPTLGSKPYLARYIQIHQVHRPLQRLHRRFRTHLPFSLATKALHQKDRPPASASMSLPDFLDINSIGTDSHLQFMNWTVDNNGAWDYAADTRGYTYGASRSSTYDQDLVRPLRPCRSCPPSPTASTSTWNVRQRPSAKTYRVRAPPQSLLGPLLSPDRKGVIRLLGWVNHANMGLYRNAINILRRPASPRAPIITAHAPASARYKYGIGLNFEQELTPNLRSYGRFGWNEGQHESYAYTEVDQTIAIGADYAFMRASTVAPSTRSASPTSPTPSSETTRTTSSLRRPWASC